MLMGQTGLGKTHLSLAIANVAIGRGLSVEYGTAATCNIRKSGCSIRTC